MVYDWKSHEIGWWHHHLEGSFEKLPIILKFDASLRKLERVWRIQNQENWGLKPRKCEIRPKYPTYFWMKKKNIWQRPPNLKSNIMQNVRQNQQKMPKPTESWTMASSAQHKDAPHRSKESVMAATSKVEIPFWLRGRSWRVISIAYLSYSFTAKIVSSRLTAVVWVRLAGISRLSSCFL